MKYRAEIDGLRAFAVIPVILFHAGFESFTGGFVGVDIFFVISGYLITSLLIKDINENQFSYADFYERRARRILPALFIVTAVTIPLAWGILIPRDLKDFFQSVIAVGTFSSNILFWQEAGYFGTSSELKPLLHTWSLAVEEQFYLLFPVFLTFAWRYGKNKVFWSICAIAGISFLISENWSRHNSTANFYLIISRAWELLAGSIAAFIVLKHGVRKNDFFAFSGLGLIIFSIFYYDESTPFPGIYALLPVIGSVLLILYAQQDTYIAKLLSIKVLVGIGLISYSAYLWHQPIIALTKYKLGTELSLDVKIYTLIATFILTLITYYLVEKPTRKKDFLSRKKFLCISATALTTLAAFGVLSASNHKDALVLFKQDIYAGEFERSLLKSEDQFKIQNGNNIYIWGDSYADALTHPLAETLSEINIGLIGYIKHACPSILGVIRNEPKRVGVRFSEKCRKLVDSTFAKLSSNHDATDSGKKIIVLTSAYLWYSSSYNIDGEPILINDNSDDNVFLNIHSALERTVRDLKSLGFHPIVVLSHPHFDDVENKIRLGEHASIAASVENAEKLNAAISENLQGLGVSLIDPIDIICERDQPQCHAFDPDKELMKVWYDGTHLSKQSGYLISLRIKEIVMELNNLHAQAL